MDPQTINTLGTSLIVALATILGSAITGYFGYKSVMATADLAKAKEEMAGVKKELVACYRQLGSYHQLEQELVEALQASVGGSQKTLKTCYRDKVVEKGFVRPMTTQTAAERRIRELEL
jgi:hypothetical protein